MSGRKHHSVKSRVLNMDNTIISPPVPFSRKIPDGLYPGRVVVVHGFIPHSGNSFRIDFNYGSEIALHISVRFNEGCIVRNHQQGGCWGTEERSPHGMGGLAKGKTFEMMILTEAMHYKIAIDGRHFAEFAHRLPFQSVNSMQITGELQLRRIEFRINYSAPAYPVQTGYPVAVCPSGPPLVPPSAGKHRPVYNPALPLKYPVLGGLCPGNVIRLSGRPTNTPHRFSLNLCCGHNSYNGNIGLHINARFDQMCVVRNSLIGGNWGAEERSGPFPFQAAVNFDLVVRVFPTCFEITVNGLYFGTFTHRITPTVLIDMLEVNGDVVVSFLHVQ